jgi:type IX secretion system PorP/SprF family membrane protein
MKKKQLLAIIFFISIFSLIKAQEAPYYREYLFDFTLLNPASGAKYDYFSIKMTAEDKWTNLPQNPIFQTLSANFKFKNNKMGLNTALLNNTYGSIAYTGAKISYFYYTKLNVDGDYISFGAYASAFQYTFDPKANIDGVNTEATDPAMGDGAFTQIYPNAGAGVFYHQKYFSLAFSAANLLPYKSKFADKAIEPAKPLTVFLYADTRMSNQIKTFIFEPSMMFLIDRDLKRQFNLNGRFIFNNSIWFGLSYRDALNVDKYSIHNVELMFGLKIMKRINFAYGYEFGILSTRSIFGSTHSLMIGYDFINIRRNNVPMYF